MPPRTTTLTVQALETLLKDALTTAQLNHESPLRQSENALMGKLSKIINEELVLAGVDQISQKYLNDQIHSAIDSAKENSQTELDRSEFRLDQLARFVGFDNIGIYLDQRINGPVPAGRAVLPERRIFDYDVFISSALEDREALSNRLHEGLSDHGVLVWYDQNRIKVGDSITKAINQGLSSSRFGLVVVSPVSLSKHWAMRELGALLTLELYGQQRILPIWHNIDLNLVAKELPLLIDHFGLFTKEGDDLSETINQLLEVIRSPHSDQ